MDLIEKIELELPSLTRNLYSIGVKRSSKKLDDILNSIGEYKIRHTKFYTKFFYESFINNSFELERIFRWYDSENRNNSMEDEIFDIEGKTIDFHLKDFPDDSSFIYEISEISEVFIACIIKFILYSNNDEYVYNLKRFLMIRLKRYTHKFNFDVIGENNLSVDGLIIEAFKSSFKTIKIKSKHEKNYEFFKDLKNSYLFDFMCKFDIAITTQMKENNIFFMSSRVNAGYNRQGLLEIIPKSIYNSDLIIHFKKAMSSEDIATKYLSFYHIIEYYFDSLYNQRIIENLRKWFIDPQICLLDDHTILNIVDEAKKLKGKSIEDGQGNEFEAFKLVLEKYIDLNKLKMKLKAFTKERMEKLYGVKINEANMLDFYKNQSVGFLSKEFKINFNDDNSVLNNIRNRIYQTRNSLVHSKDSYTLKTYNPYDDEKDLRKEIPLIKTIAIEIIVNSSTVLSNV